MFGGRWIIVLTITYYNETISQPSLGRISRISHTLIISTVVVYRSNCLLTGTTLKWFSRFLNADVRQSATKDSNRTPSPPRVLSGLGRSIDDFLAAEAFKLSVRGVLAHNLDRSILLLRNFKKIRTQFAFNPQSRVHCSFEEFVYSHSPENLIAVQGHISYKTFAKQQ